MVNIIEELKEKFKVANIPARGECIVIPLDKFQAEWDQQILEAGCDAHADGGAVYISIERYRPQPENPGKQNRRGQDWTDYEDALLIKLWNAKQKNNKEIAKHFPNRTEASVVNRLGRLKKKGIIKPRWQAKKTKEKQREIGAERVESEKPSEPVETPEPEHPPLELLFA